MIRALLALSGGADRTLLIRSVILGLLSGVAQGVTVLCIIPVLTAMFRGDWSGAVRALIVLAVVWLIHAVLVGVSTWSGVAGSLGIIRSMHRGLGGRLVHLPLSWFTSETQGRVSHTAVRGTIFVATAAMDVLAPLVGYIAMPATIAILTLFIDWRIGLAMIVAAPVLWLTSGLASKWESAGEERVRGVRTDTDLRLLEFASRQQVLRAAGIADDYPPLTRAVEKQRAAGRSALWLSLGGMVLQGFVIQTVLGCVAALAVWTVAGGSDPVRAVVLVGLVTLAAGPLRIVSSLQTALHQSEAEIDDVRELLETPTMPEPTQPIAFPPTADIEFDDVTFGYGTGDDAPLVLDGVSARIDDRSSTALVGASGSGKTTLMRLIARLWDVDGGAVRIGGVDVRDMATEDLYQHVSMIFQDVYLFDDTLWANIALGREDASRDEILDAARRAHVTEIADRLPDGWRTRVGEGGQLLSGGERQRVSIARALLRRAPVVLCDEPSSALDPSTRRAVTAALDDLSRDATVLVIAHQLETIRGANRILLLDDGSIAASGTHDELAASDERYRRFWSLREDAGHWNIGKERQG